jgi:hypothetical protein
MQQQDALSATIVDTNMTGTRDADAIARNAPRNVSADRRARKSCAQQILR